MPNDVTYLGNCSNLIDFDFLIETLNNSIPDEIGPTTSKDDQSVSEVIKVWEQAGYNTTDNKGTVKWKMYYPNSSFDLEVVNKIVDFAKIPYVNSSWISRVDPGYCVAPHFDKMPNNITPYRIHVHITDSKMGHIFYVGKTYFIDYKKGDTYLWKDPNAWHAGGNFGLSPKYILNLY